MSRSSLGYTNKWSQCLVVADHEHDGNGLQVTQGFQTHVAKKLGQFLDSCFTETQADIAIRKNPTKCDDEGFLLFSSSVPRQTADDPPPAVRRQPVPSSSDSDSEVERRLKEAAVSLKDLLPSSSLVSSPTAAAPPQLGKKKKESSDTEDDNVAKKKKKKKMRKQAGDAGGKHVDCKGSPCAQNNCDHAGSKQKHHKVKRKKKASEND
ncbi:protein CUSTOS isoform X2 [Phyllopteryx taeniolatus]|uniref:protein CUSTOS isoform X2 n=1 Tax=Phyllopteryx taeniolatus TaxID=161469 RepID=UPI002AD368D2|nr:protein CUSTOS isoform X2 [Phyllopteryx taeniolatus]